MPGRTSFQSIAGGTPDTRLPRGYMNARMSAVEFGRGTEFTLDLKGSIPETPPEVNTGPNG